MKEPLNGNGSPRDDIPAVLSSRFPRPAPPADLEARVTRSLVGAGLLRGESRWLQLTRPARLASAAAIFALGMWAGILVHRAPSGLSHDGEQRYVLLLYGAPGDSDSANDVAEHRRWARDLVNAGHDLRGEKLAPGAIQIDQSSGAGIHPPDDSSLRGFFVFTARSRADAAAIARSTPHYRHGGRVIVREIEPT